MSIWSSLAAVGLALCIALPSAAQDDTSGKRVPVRSAPTPGQNSPVDPPLPPGMKAPSEGWEAKDLTPEAIKKAEDFLLESHKVYAAAPGISEESTIALIMNNSKDANKLSLEFGAGDDMRATTSDLEMFVIGKDVFLTLGQAPGKYLKSKFKGNVNETMSALLGESALGAPSLALRRYKPGPTFAADIFGMGAPVLADLQITGSRVNDQGLQQILLKGKNGEVLADADPATKLFKRSFILVAVDPTNPNLKLPIEMLMTPKLLDKAPSIKFDPGDRVAFEGGLDLLNAQAAADRGEPTPSGGKGRGGPPAPVGKIAVGADAPSATLETPEGEKIELSSLKGKVVVLDLWATWCPPCRAGLPLLQKFADEMKGNPKVAVFAVNSIEIPTPPGAEPPADFRANVLERVNKFWSDQKFTMPSLFDYDSVLFNKFGFSGIPATIIIGPDGKVFSASTGFKANMVEELREQVKKALGE